MLQDSRYISNYHPTPDKPMMEAVQECRVMAIAMYIPEYKVLGGSGINCLDTDQNLYEH